MRDEDKRSKLTCHSSKLDPVSGVLRSRWRWNRAENKSCTKAITFGRVLTAQVLTVDHLNKAAYLAGAEKSPQRSEPGVD